MMEKIPHPLVVHGQRVPDKQTLVMEMESPNIHVTLLFLELVQTLGVLLPAAQIIVGLEQ